MPRKNSPYYSGCFKEYQFDAMVAALKILRERMLAMHNHELTLGDVLDVVLPLDLREISQLAVSKLGLPPSTSAYINLPGPIQCRAYWGHNEKPGFAFRNSPRYPQSDCEGYQKLMRWQEWQVQVETEFAAAWHVLRYANDTFKDVQVARFYFPGMLPLLGMREETRELASKWEQFKLPKELPIVPAGYPKACQDATFTINRAGMLPPEITNKTEKVGLAQDRRNHVFHTPHPFLPGSALEIMPL